MSCFHCGGAEGVWYITVTGAESLGGISPVFFFDRGVCCIKMGVQVNNFQSIHYYMGIKTWV